MSRWRVGLPLLVPDQSSRDQKGRPEWTRRLLHPEQASFLPSVIYGLQAEKVERNQKAETLAEFEGSRSRHVINKRRLFIFHRLSLPSSSSLFPHEGSRILQADSQNKSQTFACA